MSIGIAFIGKFNKEIPPNSQLLAAQKLIKDGVQSKMLHENYYLYGQRQFDDMYKNSAV